MDRYRVTYLSFLNRGSFFFRTKFSFVVCVCFSFFPPFLLLLSRRRERWGRRESEAYGNVVDYMPR